MYQGDPKTHLEDRLIDLADNFDCEVIVCTTRTKGETVEAVENLSNTRGFDTIWTSTYQIVDVTNHGRVNRIKAMHILDLLQSLSII